MSAAAGHERVPPARWVGALLAFFGLYLIVGQRLDWSPAGRLGDGLMLASAVCWAGSRSDRCRCSRGAIHPWW